MIDLKKIEAESMKRDNPAVIRSRQLGKDFLNSLMDLDIMNAGQAANGMSSALTAIVEKLAMLGALSMLPTKTGKATVNLGGTPIRDLLKGIEARAAATPEGYAAPGEGDTVH